MQSHKPVAVFYKWPLSLEGVWESVITKENNNMGKMSAFWVWRHHLLTNASLKCNLTACPHTECSVAFVSSLRQICNYTGIRPQVFRVPRFILVLQKIMHEVKKHTLRPVISASTCFWFVHTCTKMPIFCFIILHILYNTKGGLFKENVWLKLLRPMQNTNSKYF